MDEDGQAKVRMRLIQMSPMRGSLTGFTRFRLHAPTIETAIDSIDPYVGGDR